MMNKLTWVDTTCFAKTLLFVVLFVQEFGICQVSGTTIFINYCELVVALLFVSLEMFV